MNKYQPNAQNALRKKSPVKKQAAGFIKGLVIGFVIDLLLAYPYACYLASDLVPAPMDGVLSTFHPLTVLYTFFSKITDLPKCFTLTDPAMWSNLWKVWLVLAAITLLFGLFILLTSRRRGNFYGTEHGGSTYATASDRARFSNVPGAIPLQKDLYVKVGRDGDVLENFHKITFGSSGAGKTYRDLIPELLAHSGCYVVADVKGVLYTQTAKHMRQHGYDVRVLNLKDMRYSDCFNPFEYIRTDNEVTSLISTFILNTRKEGASTGDQFWEDSMELLLGSIVRYLIDTPTETKTFGRIVELVVGIELFKGRIADYCFYEQVMMERASINPLDTSVQLWKAFKQAPAETLQSVLISLTSRLKLWTTPGVLMLTGKDDFDLRTAVCESEKKTVIYIILPARDLSFKPISAMFFQTLFNVMEDAAVNVCYGKLPQTWSVLMDECFNLGKIPDFAGILTLMRAYNVRICPYFQSHGQVKEQYNKLAETVISSCAIYNYLGVTDTQTHKDISDRLGDTTIEEITPSSNGSGEKERISYIGRKLLRPEEVAQLKQHNYSIVFIAGLPAFLGDKIATEKMPGANEIGIDDPNHPNFSNNSYIEQDFAERYAANQEQFQEQIVSRRQESLNLLDLLEEDEDGGDLMLQERSPTEMFEELVEYEDPLAPPTDPETDQKLKVTFSFSGETGTETETGYLSVLKARNK